MKYIDAEKLEEEIESISLIPQTSADYNDGRDDMKMMFLDIIDSLQKEQSFLDTLEVKEVDLEKEVIDWWNAHYSSKSYTFEGYTGHYVENSTLIEIVKHFYELGLKTRRNKE